MLKENAVCRKRYFRVCKNYNDMIKQWYLKELAISKTLKKGDKGKEVEKIQQWLCIWGENNPTCGCSTKIDGDYGEATFNAVKAFQAFKKIPLSGVVNQATFDALCSPLSQAHANIKLANNATVRDYVLAYARAHLANGARELQYDGKSNVGPWVRSYMLGNEGKDWFWCAGFVTTILDLAASKFNKRFDSTIPNRFGCDTITDFAIAHNSYISAAKINANPALVKPGDLFIVRRPTVGKWVYGWEHIGIVTEVLNGVFKTIEGNTNTNGSSNGIAVYARTRSYANNSMDVISIQNMV